MRKRCQPDNHQHAYYADKGVTVCARWLGSEGFKNFLADMGERPPGTTLDRFPNGAGIYEPGNCRWATAFQQSRNRPNVKMSTDLIIEVCNRYKRGETIDQIAENLKLKKTTVNRWLDDNRIAKRKIPPPRSKPRSHLKPAFAEVCKSYGRGEKISSIVTRLGIPRTTVLRWLKQGGL
jgi:transposase-like protein